METAYRTQVNDRVLFDFGTSDRFGRWIIVNDDVMGGRSTSEMILTDEGTALFQGTLSHETHGGFASVRTLLPAHTLDDYQGLVLRVRGDGRRYRLRLRADRRLDGPAYEAEFDTVPDTWITVYVPFQETAPTFRGRRLEGLPRLAAAQITQVGLMIADAQPGAFCLELAWIQAYQPRS